MKDDTLLNHPPLNPLPEGNVALVGPIYQSVKFTVEPWRELSGADKKEYFFYSRDRNPTVRQLETVLAKLQRCEDGIAVASGVAAISCTLFALLKPGDHVIMFWESYKPSRHIVRGLLAKFGVTFSFVSVAEANRLASHILPGKTKAIFFESPTNPMTRIADIEAIAGAARKNGILTILDNTFAGLHNHRDLPVDIYIHSLTKFASGHGDVMGGVVLGPKALLEKIHDVAVHFGPTLDPHAAFLILRGLKTYSVRWERHCSNTLKIADFLSRHPRATQVRYPGLASHPDHALARKQMPDSGSILSFDLDSSFSGTEAFLRELKLFRVAASVGSTESLAAPAKLFFAGDLGAEELKITGITERTVRLSVGIEAVEDLIEDLDHALRDK